MSTYKSLFPLVSTLVFSFAAISLPCFLASPFKNCPCKARSTAVNKNLPSLALEILLTWTKSAYSCFSIPPDTVLCCRNVEATRPLWVWCFFPCWVKELSSPLKKWWFLWGIKSFYLTFSSGVMAPALKACAFLVDIFWFVFYLGLGGINNFLGGTCMCRRHLEAFDSWGDWCGILSGTVKRDFHSPFCEGAVKMSPFYQTLVVYNPMAACLGSCFFD